MRKILIITDSCSDLSAYRFSDNVFVLPCYFDYEGHMRCEYSEPDYLIRESKFNRVHSNVDAKYIDKVSANYYDVLNTMNYAVDNDMDVILLPTNGNFSERNNSNFSAAAMDFAKHNPNKNVCLFEGGSISMALGLLVKKIDELVSNGWPFEKIIHFLYRFSHLYTYEFILSDPSYLIDTTYIGGVDKFRIEHFKKEYLFKVKAGRVSIVASSDNEYGIKDILIDRFIDRANLDEEAYIVYSKNKDLAYDVRDGIEEKYCIKDIPVIEQSVCTGSVIHPASLGLAYRRK